MLPPRKTVSQVAYAVPTEPAQLEKEIMKMHAGMSITRGHHESTVCGYVEDMEWNAFDYWHRIFVHHTYNDALQVMAGKNFSVNVTRWGRLPIFIQVSNAWLRPGILLQTMVVLGVIYCHQVVRLTQQGDDCLFQVDWWTASHWMFRWLHGPFNRRMLKLQRVQDAEDLDIRQQRFALRKAGFHFTTDDPDFLNSNELTDNVIVPPFPSAQAPLGDLSDGQWRRIALGPLAFWVQRKDAGVQVWPAVCPHEGAALTEQHLCGETLHCPWHGRKFRAVTLEPGKRGQWQFLNTVVTLHDGHLTMTRLEPGTKIS